MLIGCMLKRYRRMARKGLRLLRMKFDLVFVLHRLLCLFRMCIVVKGKLPQPLILVVKSRMQVTLRSVSRLSIGEKTSSIANELRCP